MRLKIAVFLQAVLLLLMICVPAGALANTGDITMMLNKTTVSTGESVTASGVTVPNAWVPLKVIDGSGNILVFDAKKADAEGNYIIDFIAPSGAAGTLTVVAGEGSAVVARSLTVKSTSSGGGGGGGGGETSATVTSNTGVATMTPQASGHISMGSEATVEIPANALTGTNAVEVKIEKVSTPPAAPAGFRIAGSVYEFSVDGKTSYNFAKKVTITLKFDPDALSEGEIPSIHYYDQKLGRWVNLGGEVSGNTISVKVDHFTKYAVMILAKQPGQIITDIAGHWAEVSIKELVGLGAVNGYPDGTFRPNDKITRAEFAAILVKALKLEPKSGKVFADTEGHWAEETISTAAYYGIVSGYDSDTFGVKDPITREQMAAMIVRAAKLTPVTEELSFIDEDKISGWAKEAVAAAVKNGIIKGYPDQNFHPQGHATRAEAVTVIVNSL